ncbi:P1 family peptidase [Promineifilum sp.]|uniref:P1 family peptidase n=1 Tax=Promineifilum sp. TaxID=2664178 RepID=UPI0035B0CB60
MINFAGIRMGHATHTEFPTGCTVFLCPNGTFGSVEARGPAPGSRELAVLAPDKPDDKAVNAVVLTGGSAFGLATADGVMRYLSERGIGHPTPVRPVPIVPAAVVFDLGWNPEAATPDAAMGYVACVAAESYAGVIEQGNVGVGAGVFVGKWAGWPHMMKGGFGVASLTIEGVEVAAAVVVNAVGDVVDEDGRVLAGARAPGGGWLADSNPLRFVAEPVIPPAGTNTTLVVVATDAILSRSELARLTHQAHNGLAIAVRPSHTRHDGDVAFTLSTERVAAPINLVSNMAVAVVAEAIRNAVRHAATVFGVPGLAG